MSAAVSSFKFVADPAPQDKDGYCVAFRMDQTAELTEFFRRFGFVVIRDAISPKAVEDTKQDIFSLANFDHTPTYAELEALNWDEKSEGAYNTKKGFLGFEPSWSEVAWSNRLALYPAYSALFKRPDLILKLDRYGIMRPTKFWIEDKPDDQKVDAESCAKKSKSEGKWIERPEWQTESRWLHWDQNPWEEPNFVRIQGVLAISEHTESSGGFHCVPGFASQWASWGQANQKFANKASLFDVPPDDPMREAIQRITMRPGSALLWDSRTPHGNFPNTSPGWRLCQYLGFHPAPTAQHNSSLRLNRRRNMLNLVSADAVPRSLVQSSPIRKLLGLEFWDNGAPHELTAYTLSQIGLFQG